MGWSSGLELWTGAVGGNRRLEQRTGAATMRDVPERWAGVANYVAGQVVGWIGGLDWHTGVAGWSSRLE